MSVKFYIANWKMNKTIDESISFLKKFVSNYNDIKDKKVVFCPSFISLARLSELELVITSDYFSLGAQNVSNNSSGAYTGEISVDMLRDTIAKYCIVGHSERRNIYKESNGQINSKIKRLSNTDIIPILCVGETTQEKDSGLGEQVILDQLSSCLKDVEHNRVIIAYEPVWAIGTGRNAEHEDISHMNIIIKNHMNKLGYIDEQFYILYGGSVNIDNVNTLKEAKYINGFLIGGASLDADNFLELIKK